MEEADGGRRKRRRRGGHPLGSTHGWFDHVNQRRAPRPRSPRPPFLPMSRACRCCVDACRPCRSVARRRRRSFGSCCRHLAAVGRRATSATRLRRTPRWRPAVCLSLVRPHVQPIIHRSNARDVLNTLAASVGAARAPLRRQRGRSAGASGRDPNHHPRTIRSFANVLECSDKLCLPFWKVREASMSGHVTARSTPKRRATRPPAGGQTCQPAGACKTWSCAVLRSPCLRVFCVFRCR